MIQVRLVVFAWVLALLLVGGRVGAQDVSPSDQSKSAGEATAVVKRMADFLSGTQKLSVTADIGFDAVQDDGQKFEFGETRKILLSRPDHLRIDETKRNGDKSELTFDGKSIMLYYAQDNVYALVDKPGTVDDAVSYFVNDLGMRLPLAELINSKLSSVLQGRILSAAYVEKSSIDGVPCDQIALRGADADMQLWVAQGPQPLPQRVVITYKKLDGRPQFWAQFSDWNLKPKVSDKLFSVTPPKGTVKIEFAAQQMLQPGQ